MPKSGWRASNLMEFQSTLLVAEVRCLKTSDNYSVGVEFQSTLLVAEERCIA